MNNTLQEQQRLQDKYTKMWYSDYLLSLRETSRDVFQSEWIDKISVGDIVLIDTRDRPRVYWQMGRVLQLIHSNDGRVRQVILKTAKVEGRYATRLLYPLEVRAVHAGTAADGCNSRVDGNSLRTEPPADISRPNVRPARRAASGQRQLVQDLIRSGSL